MYANVTADRVEVVLSESELLHLVEARVRGKSAGLTKKVLGMPYLSLQVQPDGEHFPDLTNAADFTSTSTPAR